MGPSDGGLVGLELKDLSRDRFAAADDARRALDHLGLFARVSGCRPPGLLNVTRRDDHRLVRPHRALIGGDRAEIFFLVGHLGRLAGEQTNYRTAIHTSLQAP